MIWKFFCSFILFSSAQDRSRPIPLLRQNLQDTQDALRKEQYATPLLLVALSKNTRPNELQDETRKTGPREFPFPWDAFCYCKT